MASKSAPIAEAWIQLAPTLDGSERRIQKQLAGVGAPAGRAAGRGFSSGLRGAVTGIAALGIGKQVFDLGRDSINAASDLGETINALDVLYGKAGEQINELGEGAARRVGLSNRAFNELAVGFAGFAKEVDHRGGKVANTIDDLTTRAADFASVNNLEVAEAAQVFQSFLAGETEPLRQHGIALNQASVDSYAYANGIAEVGEQLTEAEKVQARYGLLMQETNVYAGDFANTSESLANKQRTLAGEWENVQAKFGQAILPLATGATNWLADTAIPWIDERVDEIQDADSPIGKFADAVGRAWNASSGPIGNAFSTGASWGANIINGYVDAFDAYNEGGGEGLVDYLAGKGAELSEWADAGDSIGQKIVGGIDGVFESYFDGSLWPDTLALAGNIGGAIASWAQSGDSFPQQVIASIDGVFADYFEGGFPALVDGWLNGADEAVDRASNYQKSQWGNLADALGSPSRSTSGRADGKDTITGKIKDFASGYYIPPVSAAGPGDINANGQINPVSASRFGAYNASGPQITIQNATFTDTDDAARTAAKSARYSQFGGIRPSMAR